MVREFKWAWSSKVLSTDVALLSSVRELVCTSNNSSIRESVCSSVNTPVCVAADLASGDACVNVSKSVDKYGLSR